MPGPRRGRGDERTSRRRRRRSRRRRQLLVRRNRSLPDQRRVRLHDKIRESYMYRYRHVYTYVQGARAGYSLLEMRPAFASTSDPSGSRRATNRVTARDPRPKSSGSLPFLPSFLPAPRSATSLFPSSALPDLSLHLPSVLFLALLLLAAVIGFFLYSVGQYNRFLAVEDTWLPSCLQTGKEAKGNGMREGKERERIPSVAQYRANCV